MDESLKSIFVDHGGIMETAELMEAGYYYKKSSSFLKAVKLSRYVGDTINIQVRILSQIFRQSRLFFRMV